MGNFEIKSVRDMFHDHEGPHYVWDVICNYNGELIYTIYDGDVYYEFNEISFLTEQFCKMNGFTSEQTLVWLLSFGQALPKHVTDI